MRRFQRIDTQSGSTVIDLTSIVAITKRKTRNYSVEREREGFVVTLWDIHMASGTIFTAWSLPLDDNSWMNTMIGVGEKDFL